MQEGVRNVSQVRIENGIIMFYGNKAGRVEDGCAVVDPMFKGNQQVPGKAAAYPGSQMDGRDV